MEDASKQRYDDEFEYTEEIFDQLCEDLKSATDFSADGAYERWTFDDCVPFTASEDKLKKLRDFVISLPAGLKIPTGSNGSAESAGDIDGVTVMFKSINGETDGLVFWANGACEIMYGIEFYGDIISFNGEPPIVQDSKEDF